MEQRAGDVIRDVRHHAPHSVGGEEWLKINVQRIAVDEGQVSTRDLFGELLLEPREKIVIKFDRNHPRTGRQEAFGQYAEPRTNLQDDLTWCGTSGRDDRIACLKIHKEALAETLLRHMPCNKRSRTASTRHGAHPAAAAPNGHEALTVSPRAGSCSVTRCSASAACAAAPIMAALSVHQRTGGMLRRR